MSKTKALEAINPSDPIIRLWDEAQALLKSRLSADTYNLWFAPIRATALENETIRLQVSNDFCELWLKDNYLDLLQHALMHAAGKSLKIKFEVGTEPSQAAGGLGGQRRTRTGEPAARVVLDTETLFNPKNTFDTFVVGNSN